MHRKCCLKQQIAVFDHCLIGSMSMCRKLIAYSTKFWTFCSCFIFYYSMQFQQPLMHGPFSHSILSMFCPILGVQTIVFQERALHSIKSMTNCNIDHKPQPSTGEWVERFNRFNRKMGFCYTKNTEIDEYKTTRKRRGVQAQHLAPAHAVPAPFPTAKMPCSSRGTEN